MMGKPEGEERRKGAEKVFAAIMGKKFLDLLNNITPPGSLLSSK